MTNLIFYTMKAVLSVARSRACRIRSDRPLSSIRKEDGAMEPANTN
jgi:hypothetical protein